MTDSLAVLPGHLPGRRTPSREEEVMSNKRWLFGLSLVAAVGFGGQASSAADGDVRPRTNWVWQVAAAGHPAKAVVLCATAARASTRCCRRHGRVSPFQNMPMLAIIMASTRLVPAATCSMEVSNEVCRRAPTSSSPQWGCIAMAAASARRTASCSSTSTSKAISFPRSRWATSSKEAPLPRASSPR